MVSIIDVGGGGGGGTERRQIAADCWHDRRDLE